MNTLADLPVGSQVQFRDFLAVIESQDGHAVHGRTQSGVRFGVRKTHNVQIADEPALGFLGFVNVRALHVSPSQLTQYMYQCPRQWALDKIGGVPRPGNEYSDRGGLVHAVLENWQRYAIPPDTTTYIGRIAYSALACTPAPGTATPERCVNWEIDGLEIEFLKDLEAFTADGVEIYDYKTTSNLAYAHTAKDLLETDPQAIVYAAHAFLAYNAPTVRASWLYLTANKPHRCLPVIVEPQRETCLERFSLILGVGKAMIAHRIAQTDSSTFPTNLSHCSAFGGCPYKGTHCIVDPTQELLNKMTQSIFSQIAAVGQPAPAPQTPPQPPAIAWPPTAAPVAQPAQPAALAQSPVWLTAPAAPQTAPVVDPSFAPQPTPATIPAPPQWLQPATAAAVVTPEANAPVIPIKRTRKCKETSTQPGVIMSTEPVETTYEDRFFDLLVALAMNPTLAAHPAVDLADRALALVTCGQKALGQ
jgi:hypothetical protein